MCLILIALKSHPTYKLIIAGNRDEYYDRPTAQAAFWDDAPELLAGRDLRAGGTWFGITKQGRIAAVTDYRDPASDKGHVSSRGELVSNFLLGQAGPAHYIDMLTQSRDIYNGYNLIVGESDELYWYSNRGGDVRNLSPAIYALSNHLVDTPWPKVIRGKAAFGRLLSWQKDLSPDDLFAILLDRSIPDDESLPNTGVGLEWERILSPIFITSPIYGTRSSTLLLIDYDNRVEFIERTYYSDSEHAKTIRYKFKIER